MNKGILFRSGQKKLLIITICTLLVFIISSCSDPEKESFNNPKVVSVCFDDSCVIAHHANTKERREPGFMYRKELVEDEAMLFSFEKEDNHSIWMKNTPVALDIIWISEDLSIVHIENASPCITELCPTYKSDKLAKYILEAKQGLVKKLNISIKTKIELILA
jgi:uncharacterized protein